MSLGLPYVRDAKPFEFEEVALVIARAFHNDPLMNWMGSVSRKIPLPPRSSMRPTSLSSLPKELEILYYFHHSLVLATHMVHGRVLVVCKSDGASQDFIVAASLWVPPNTKIDTPWIIIRSKQYRTMFGSWRRLGGWGFTGLKRAAFTYEYRMDKVQREACDLKNTEFKSAWHLMDVATDPEEEGRGNCSRLIRHGLEEIVKDALVYIEATTPRSREIYEHLGFETTDSPVFGRKQVTDTGLPPVIQQNQTATGFPVWSMLRRIQTEPQSPKSTQ